MKEIVLWGLCVEIEEDGVKKSISFDKCVVNCYDDRMDKALENFLEDRFDSASYTQRVN